MDVGVYGRLSVAKREAEATDLAIDRQHQRCIDYCNAKGWTPVRFYSDLDPAYRKPGRAKAPRRDEFEQGLADVEAGAIAGLVFFKLDRFVRDHGDFERALAVSERHGAILASVTEPLDTSSPMGEAVARLLVTFARLESQTIALRVAAQAEQKASMGRPWLSGRHRPYGYDPTDRVTIIQHEAETIRTIAARLLAGQSQGEVLGWLEQAAIPAPEGGRWNRAKMGHLLRNPRLAGLRRYHGEIVAQCIWETILDPETFQRLGQLFERRRQPGRPARRFLLSGIVHCGCCGAIMDTQGHKGGSRYVCYAKSERAVQVAEPCGKVSIVADPLDRLVAICVLDALAGPGLERRRRRTDDAKLQAIADRQEADKGALIQAAKERFVDRTLEPASYAEVKLLLERRIADADRQLDVSGASNVLATLPRLRGDLEQMWERADIERRREIVRAALERVEVRPAQRRGPGVDPARILPDGLIWRA
jgi:site-specific DNA recombinase